MINGQISITDYLQSKIVNREVMDLTSWINSHGRSQYKQIGDVIEKACEDEEVITVQLIGRITNQVSIYVLQQSLGYMNYLRDQSKI